VLKLLVVIGLAMFIGACQADSPATTDASQQPGITLKQVDAKDMEHVAGQEALAMMMIPGEKEPGAATATPDKPARAAPCWVVLEWCRLPGTNSPYCTYTLSCSNERAIEACASLIRETC
jgi:hypothetical protein